MSKVIPFERKPNSNPASVEEAWNEYARLVRLIQSDQNSRLDYDLNVSAARAWNRWQRLFLAGDAA